MDGPGHNRRRWRVGLPGRYSDRDTGVFANYSAVSMRTEPTTNGGLPRAAAAIAAAAWLLVAASVTFAVLARPGLAGENLFLLVDITVAAVYGTVAAVILWRRQHLVVWLLALTAIGGGLSATAGAYTMWFFSGADVPWAAWIQTLYGTAWVPGTISLFTVVPWLVRDHPLGRAIVGVIAGAAISVALSTVRALQLQDEVLRRLIAVAIAIGLIAAADVARRHLRGPVAERVGLGWLAVGTAVMALSFVPLLLPFGSVPYWVTPVMHLACQAVFPAAILVSVLRQRLWGIDLAVSRTVTAGVLTVTLLGLYAAVAAVVTSIVGDSDDAAVIAAVAIVLTAMPLMMWIDRRVRHLVYGAGHDPAVAARELSSRLGRPEDADDLLTELVGSVCTMLRLESATIEVDGRPVAGVGEPTSPGHPVELVHAGEVLGVLTVTARPGEALGGRTTRSLTELSPVVATGLAVTLTAWRLEGAQAELTRARLEERRLIRRELHDGLGPSLTGLRLGLQGARNLVTSDPSAAAEILGSLQSELDRRVDEVRDLSHSLLPPVLEQLGLQAALTELAGRHQESGLQVDLHCPHIVTLPDTVAAAAYAIVSEALTNVTRHSGARQASVDVERGDEVLRIEVTDDGDGLAADRTPGVGTSSMRERAEELGGELTLADGADRGAVVTAALPLPARTIGLPVARPRNHGALDPVVLR